MLKTHMDAVEAQLLSISKIPANSGHTLHKGTPREAFIKQYLENHLPSNVAIGTGEIIDANSQPNVSRNQYDIVVYKRSYPKLDFGGGISGFLIESVVATIEVKSNLTQAEFAKAASAAKNAKSLTPNLEGGMFSGYMPPKVLNYIVAYDGPAMMSTVHGWIGTEYAKLGMTNAPLPVEANKRIATAADALDGIFILGKGFVYYDNVPSGFINDQNRQSGPNKKWVYSDMAQGNLMLLFLMLQIATANIDGRLLNTVKYLANFRVNNIHFDV